MPTLTMEQRPAELRCPEVPVVFVGGCKDRGDGSRFRAKAHTHEDGSICFLSARRLADRMLVLHELAHALSGVGHTDKWRDKVLEIGGTLDAVPGLLKDYNKRTRRVK